MRILFLSDGNLQLTSFKWPLMQVRLEGGQLLSNIVTWCSKHATSFGEDSGLEGVPKNPYHHIKQRKLDPTVDLKLKKRTFDAEVQNVSSLKCCKYRCC